MVRASVSFSRRIANACLVASLAAGPALAREKADWTRQRPGRFHFGPFFLTPRLELRILGDSNVYNEADDPARDAAVVARPSLRVALPVGSRMRLRADGSLDFSRFHTATTQGATDYAFEGAGELDFGPLTFFGAGGAQETHQRFTIEINERIPREERYAAAGADLRLGRTFTLTARGEERRFRYGVSRLSGAALPQALDRDARTGAVDLRARLTVFTTALGSGEVIEDTFVHETGDARLARSYRVLGGFELDRGALFSGTVLVGVRHIPGSPAAGIVPYTGPAVRVTTQVPLGTAARVYAAVERDVFYGLSAPAEVEPGPSSQRDTYVSRRYEAGLEASLPLGLLARGSYSIQEARYLGASASAGSDRLERLHVPAVTLVRLFRDWLRIGGTVSFARRVGNLPGQSYRALQYGVTAELVP